MSEEDAPMQALVRELGDAAFDLRAERDELQQRIDKALGALSALEAFGFGYTASGLRGILTGSEVAG